MQIQSMVYLHVFVKKIVFTFTNLLQLYIQRKMHAIQTSKTKHFSADPLKKALGMYLHVFCVYFCVYLHIYACIACINAISTFSCLNTYTIHAYTYTKYIQDTCKY